MKRISFLLSLSGNREYFGKEISMSENRKITALVAELAVMYLAVR